MSKIRSNLRQTHPIEKYYVNEHRIPTCFEKCNFKPEDTISVKVSHIYDPSKFWIVVKTHEFEVFQKYMFRLYYISGKKFKISKDEIVMNLYCVAFNNNTYYRGIVVGFPSSLSPQPEVSILFIDYGMVKSVNVQDIYYLTKKCHAVPQFAIRASLAGICPLKSMEWRSDDAREFYLLTMDKVLVGLVVNVAEDRQVLEVHLADQIDNIPIHQKLIEQKRARYFYQKMELTKRNLPYRPKLKYPYLFPSHEALESGQLPTKLCDAEYEVQLSSLLSVLDNYYEAVNN